MKLNKQSNTIAAVGTILFMVAVFLLLWFIYIHIPQPEEDEGIVVTFAQDEEVIDEPEPVEQIPASAAEAAPSFVESSNPKVTTPKSVPEPLMTQEDEAALQAARAEKEKQRKQNEAIAKAQQMASLFGNTSSDDLDNGAGGRGTSTTSNPLSKGTSGGNDWSLNGRHLVGALPKPSAEFNQEGKVVVQIQVNKEGRVVSARAGQGTTISDEATRQLAVKAALKAQFDMVDRPNAVMGTITYYFKFK